MNTNKKLGKSKLSEIIHYVLHIISRSIADVIVIISNPYNLADKTALIYAYMKMWLKTYLLYRFFIYNDEHLLNFRVYGPTYKFIYGTFRETFVRGNYWFNSHRRNPIIFDCGANIGMATLYWKWLYSNARIYSFEPNPEAAKYLRRNVRKNNLSDVDIFELALGQKASSKKFYVHQVERGSLKASFYGGTIFSGRTKKISVKVDRLSKFIGKKVVDLLKLDIEAGEYDVMDELSKTDKLKQIREILMECHIHIPHTKLQLGKLLHTLEDSGFEYQLSSNCVPLYQKSHYQDVMVYAYRK